MSSNNQLIILKKKDKFEVHMHLCVDNEFEPKYHGYKTLLNRFKTLVEAIKFANDYVNEEAVEYGYYICDSCLV